MTKTQHKNILFNSFQLEEYKNISNSHFESVKQVTIFFRYYLLILAAPVFFLTLISKKDNGLDDLFIGKLNLEYYIIIFSYFGIIAIIGFFIFLYVVNIRHDAILYAKTVNKVRRYFYNLSDLDIKDYEKYSHLPLTSTVPKYKEITFFSPLLLVFSIINSGILVAAFYFYSLKTPYFSNWNLPYDLPINTTIYLVVFFIFFLTHIIGYQYLAQQRDNNYLKHYSFGVDIDGVLNNQTEHFIEWLKKLRHISINKEDIKEIPVHLNQNIKVTDFDERVVFNTKEYWESIPPKEKAAIRINDFQKKFGYKIFFFSYRDWPQYGEEEENIKTIIKSKNCTPLKKGEISNITTDWLKKNSIKSTNVKGLISSIIYFIKKNILGTNKLVIELGNPYISDIRYWNKNRKAILNQNRFQGAKMQGFRFFIEDTPENAIKISSLCDYVFMFDEPYNKEQYYNFPKNVIRVKSWDDVYRYLKILS